MTEGTTCFWCGVNPRKEMPNGISPHSTWCPQYRPPPTARQIKREFDEMVSRLNGANVQLAETNCTKEGKDEIG